MSADDAHRFVIAYDIIDDLRRSKVAKILESYGDRLQYSLFFVDIKPARLIKLRTSLSALLGDEDSVLVINLGPVAHGGTRRIEFLGPQRPIIGPGPMIY